MAWKCPECGYLQRLSHRCKRCGERRNNKITVKDINLLYQKHKIFIPNEKRKKVK